MTIKAEINRSCTPEQAKSFRKVLEEQGWVEGVDFIDHTERGTRCYSKAEMDEFRGQIGWPEQRGKGEKTEFILAYRTFYRRKEVMLGILLSLLGGALLMGIGLALALGWRPWI